MVSVEFLFSFMTKYSLENKRMGCSVDLFMPSDFIVVMDTKQRFSFSKYFIRALRIRRV